jgi:hypothetical protein
MVKLQLWYCESCGVLGGFMYGDDEDVVSVAFGMGAQHRKASPGCESRAVDLKILVVENIHEPFVLKPHESTKR